MKYTTALIVSILFLISCSSNQPKMPPSTPEAHWQVLDGESYCFPVDNDVFDRPIDHMPMPIAPHDDIWPRVQSGLTFNYVDHRSVRAQLNWYVKHPKYFLRVQKRASRYLYFIIEHLHEQNVPFDIALLPIVESAYEPFSYSHGQASGLWQFIPMTGKRFKLDKDWWKDERRDPVQSTEAAIKYLKYLHRYFDNDWYLAIAAYNAGEGTVRKAVRKNQKKGLPIDFFSLDLPVETSAYVPKMIALSEIFQNPEKYNIPLLKIDNQAYFDSVELTSQLDLSQAAELADVNLEEIYYLNASLNRWATPPEKAFSLNLPVNSIEHFKQGLSTLPESERVTWHRHTIKSGDSLIRLAQQYNTDVSVIKNTNRLRSNSIVVGKTLMIPSAKKSGSYQYSQNALLQKRQSAKPKNGLYKTVYYVRPGDSFWSIAKEYKVDIKALAKWNKKSPRDTLKQGEKLIVWHKNKAKAKQLRTGKISKINYRIRSGDSLAKVADKFNIRINQIIKWNKLDPEKYLQPGQKLTLYVDIMETY